MRETERWLAEHYRKPNVVASAVEYAAIPERTLKRRFKMATGCTLIDYVQNLRVEEAKRLLESTPAPVDQIAVEVGYENAAFFRRLFKRSTGLGVSQYRRMFQPMLRSSERRLSSEQD